ncbi:polyprenyl synthetase family protein [Candidatus Bathyarchaeota archaeon]|nr:polyprenyl synthetase family protein [Candidatus Bathyarchaeota archaeon]
MSEITDLVSLGKMVDPVMLSYIDKGADARFIPVLKHQILAGGKRIRAVLTILSCEAAGGDASNALKSAALIELIHNYSLIMDDIIDHGEVRRGKPTVRAKYSDVMAILAGMFYREVLDEIVDDCPKPVEMRKLMINAIKETIEGERLDILFEQAGREEDYIKKHRYKNVSLKLYFKMISKKTAALIKAACIAGGLAANASSLILDALKAFGWNIGLAFQVVDDILDIYGEKTGKEKGKDIIEHKLGNIAILFSLRNLSGKEKIELVNILRKPKVSRIDLNKALKLIEKTEARDKAYDLGRSFINEGKKALLSLQDSEAKSKLLSLADFILNRAY